MYTLYSTCSVTWILFPVVLFMRVSIFKLHPCTVSTQSTNFTLELLFCFLKNTNLGNNLTQIAPVHIQYTSSIIIYALLIFQ